MATWARNKDKKKRFKAWYALDEEDRVPPSWTELSKELGVSLKTLRGWREKKNGKKPLDLENMSPEEKRALFERIMVDLFVTKTGTAEDRKTLGKYWGLIVDKSEQKNINVNLTADDIIKLEREARGLNEAQGYGIGTPQVLDESSLLSPKLRLHTGQDSTEDR